MNYKQFAFVLSFLSISHAYAEVEQPGCNLITDIPARSLKFFGTRELPGSGLGRYYDDYLWHVNGTVYCRLQTIPFDKTHPKADCAFGERQVRDCRERAPVAPQQ